MALDAEERKREYIDSARNATETMWSELFYLSNREWFITIDVNKFDMRYICELDGISFSTISFDLTQPKVAFDPDTIRNYARLGWAYWQSRKASQSL